jgi:hypothetical protein
MKPIQKWKNAIPQATGRCRLSFMRFSVLTVMEHPTLPGVAPRWLLQPDCYHEFMEAQIRFFVKGYSGNDLAMGAS